MTTFRSEHTSFCWSRPAASVGESSRPWMDNRIYLVSPTPQAIGTRRPSLSQSRLMPLPPRTLWLYHYHSHHLTTTIPSNMSPGSVCPTRMNQSRSCAYRAGHLDSFHPHDGNLARSQTKNRTPILLRRHLSTSSDILRPMPLPSMLHLPECHLQHALVVALLSRVQ